jgi:hypothetical protein
MAAKGAIMLEYTRKADTCAAAFDAYTPEERARALYYFFGWQGGTIHQLADATGISADDLLHRKHGYEPSLPAVSGFSAIRTCGTAWRRDTLAPKRKGDWAYWRDAIRGFWITGPMDGLNDRYATNHAH